MSLIAIDKVAVTGFLRFPALLARVILASIRHDIVGQPNDVAAPCGTYVSGVCVLRAVEKSKGMRLLFEKARSCQKTQNLMFLAVAGVAAVRPVGLLCVGHALAQSQLAKINQIAIWHRLPSHMTGKEKDASHVGSTEVLTEAIYEAR